MIIALYCVLGVVFAGGLGYGIYKIVKNKKAGK